MFTHYSDAFLKPDILPPATAKMTGKNVNGSSIFRGQEQAHTLTGRLDPPGNLVVAPLATNLQRETEIG
jgi:hypothetical protein